jgi:hypothetical protein
VTFGGQTVVSAWEFGEVTSMCLRLGDVPLHTFHMRDESRAERIKAEDEGIYVK